MILVSELTKRRGDRAVLDRVSLRLDAGRVTAIVGPSGGGKTTLLRCVVGLDAFDEGSIEAFGARLSPGAPGPQRAELARVRAKVGLVFQAFHLFGHETALANVALAPVHVQKVPPRDALARARALLERVDLTHREGAYPHELSGGEQQRVAIARALAMQPAALLLDEPTSALDPERTARLVAILEALRDEGTAIVVVTHEIALASRLADRVVVLHEGKVVEDGAPREVLASPKDARTRALLGV